MRLLFILSLAFTGLAFANTGKILALDANLRINIEPIICTIDSVNNGISNNSYLTPENCSNYYELFPKPTDNTQSSGPNSSNSFQQTESNAEPTIIVKKPTTGTTVRDQPVNKFVDNIRDDPLTTTIVLFAASSLLFSFVDFYKEKPTDKKQPL